MENRTLMESSIPASPTTTQLHSELMQWVEQAASQQIGWSELAERLLQFEQSTRQHHPDVDRRRRCGFSEVIYGAGKSDGDVIQIARRLLDAAQADETSQSVASTEVLVTRFDRSFLTSVASQFPFTRYDTLARTLRIAHRPITEVNVRRPKVTSANNQSADSPALPHANDSLPGEVMVVTAGSTDLPVAREAVETLRWMGFAPGFITDVGVAGPYRLLGHIQRLRRASVVVVVAGMEGALASVMGGLVQCPIIAVPTSVGYGANLGGVTTLLSMLSSCAAGVTVVNIDGGFKGGYVAGLITAGYQRLTR